MKEIILVLNTNEKMIMDTQDFITGFNKFIKENKEKEATLSLYTFNSTVQSIFDHTLISEVVLNKNIVSFGECEFYNSLGTILERVSDRINRLKGKYYPEEVIFVLITESFLDVSKNYTKEEIHTFITYQKEDYFWNFLVFGVGLKNNMEELGFLPEDIYSIDYTESGISKIFSVISKIL